MDFTALSHYSQRKRRGRSCPIEWEAGVGTCVQAFLCSCSLTQLSAEMPTLSRAPSFTGRLPSGNEWASLLKSSVKDLACCCSISKPWFPTALAIRKFIFKSSSTWFLFLHRLRTWRSIGAMYWIPKTPTWNFPFYNIDDYFFFCLFKKTRESLKLLFQSITVKLSSVYLWEAI